MSVQFAGGRLRGDREEKNVDGGKKNFLCREAFRSTKKPQKPVGKGSEICYDKEVKPRLSRYAYGSTTLNGDETLLDLRECKRIVVKVGTSTLTYENGKLNLRRIEKLVRTLSDMKNFGREVVLVTSGAVGAGVSRLGWREKPKELRQKQAAAAVGQSEIMNLYSRFFGEYGHTVAQLLLTRDVVDHPERKQNVINTFQTLLEYGTVPIVNENDPISTYEIEQLITFGENDTLAAVVAQLVQADLLILLSDIDGLFDADPRQSETARLIPVVYEVTDELRALAGGEGTNRGTGGMLTKLGAAKLCLDNDIPMVIANGERPEIVQDILDGRHAGTIFVPKKWK